MRNRLCWIVLGGLSFWLPMIITAGFHQDMGLWTLNLIPLAGVTLLGAASYMLTGRMPRWGWVLAGIYALGPVSMLIPSQFINAPSAASVPGEWAWVLLFCLFPPMTLWLALLNGMIYAVLVATLAMSILAAYQRGWRPSSAFA